VEVQDLHWEYLWVHRGRIEASGVVALDVLSVIRARACCRIDISVPALWHTALPIFSKFLLARLDIGQLLGTIATIATIATIGTIGTITARFIGSLHYRDLIGICIATKQEHNTP
jgi:hypothetical protein